MTDENSEPEMDEDGLVIQRHQSRVLIITLLASPLWLTNIN